MGPYLFLYMPWGTDILLRYGNSRFELSCAGSVVPHEDWSKLSSLRDIKQRLESEFHTKFNAVQCSLFRTGTIAFHVASVWVLITAFVSRFWELGQFSRRHPKRRNWRSLHLSGPVRSIKDKIKEILECLKIFLLLGSAISYYRQSCIPVAATANCLRFV